MRGEGMEMMKACRLHSVGDFRCDTVEIPVPHGDELLLRVGACGICGSDLPRVFEHGSSNGKYPLTIGHEFAGEVLAVGETADPALIGARGAIYPLIRSERASMEALAMTEPACVAQHALVSSICIQSRIRNGKTGGISPHSAALCAGIHAGTAGASGRRSA